MRKDAEQPWNTFLALRNPLELRHELSNPSFGTKDQPPLLQYFLSMLYTSLAMFNSSLSFRVRGKVINGGDFKSKWMGKYIFLHIS